MHDEIIVHARKTAEGLGTRLRRPRAQGPCNELCETSTFTADMDTKVPPPKELLTPLDYLPSLGLFGPGPCNPSERVVKAATLPLQDDATDVFQRVVDEIKAGLQYVFQTRNKYTLAVCGAGHAAMETAIVNVMERGQTIVICVNGFWGARAREIAERQGN